MTPQTPLFSPITRQVNGYKQNTSNATRPLMYPDEIEHMDNRECLIMVRGQKPLKALKIIPDELSDFHKLKRTRVTEYIPKWRYNEENGISETDNIPYSNDFTDIDNNEENPFDEFDLSKVEIISSSVRTNTEKDEEENDENIVEEDFDPRPLTAQNMIDKFKRGK